MSSLNRSYFQTSQSLLSASHGRTVVDAHNSHMVGELRRALPTVVAPVNVCDGNPCELFIGDVDEAPDIDAVHLADRSFIANSEAAHATVSADVVMILPGIEQILRQISFSREQAEAFWLCHGYPLASPTTYGTVAAIGTLRQIEVGLERNGAAVAATLVCLQHHRTFTVQDGFCAA